MGAALSIRPTNRRKLTVDVEPLYQPSDLLRFVDLGGGALVPGSTAVVYVANTLDGETASKDTALWLSDGGEHRRLAPADAAQSRPSVSPDGTRVAFLQVQADADGQGRHSALRVPRWRAARRRC